MASRKDLKTQFEQAKLRGWIPHFEAAAARHGFSTADLMGIASRESNMKNIKGDFHDGQYHGLSLMQLDINSHREWIESGKWQDAQAAIFKGAEALAQKRDQIVKTAKMKSARVRFRSGQTVSFTPRQLTDQALRHCMLAAYNCGGAAYYHYSIGNDIDRGTTGRNYGRDVIARSAVFESFLNSETPSPVAPPTARPAESVKDQEESASAAQAESPAEVSTNPESDLLGAAVNSSTVKQGGKKLLPRLAKHSGAALTWLYAFYEANKFGVIVIVLVVLAGLLWLVYHNRKKLKPHVLKLLK